MEREGPRPIDHFGRDPQLKATPPKTLLHLRLRPPHTEPLVARVQSGGDGGSQLDGASSRPMMAELGKLKILLKFLVQNIYSLWILSANSPTVCRELGMPVTFGRRKCWSNQSEQNFNCITYFYITICSANIQMLAESNLSPRSIILGVT